jgi:hypothetical protein
MDIQHPVNTDQSWLNSARQSMTANGGPELRSRLHKPTPAVVKTAQKLAPKVIGARDSEVRGSTSTHVWKTAEADSGVLHSSGRKARALSAQACTHRLAGGRAALTQTATRPSISRGSLGR